MNYNELLIEADTHGLIVKEKPLKGCRGRIKGNRIAIKKDLSNDVEKACVLAEELGHYHTTVGNILDQSKIENRKKERLARAWGYERLINLMDIIKAKEAGVKNRYELAEYLNVEEQFLEAALQYFRSKYGAKYVIGNYVISLEPLNVYEKIF